MTDLFEEAVTAALTLSPEAQDEVARVVLAFVKEGRSVYRFSPDEAAELDESQAAAARRDFATDDEVQAIWTKHGL